VAQRDAAHPGGGFGGQVGGEHDGAGAYAEGLVFELPADRHQQRFG